MIVLAWVALATVALAVAAELAARAWLRRSGYYVWAPWKKTRMHVDRESLPALEPVVRFEVNGEGERGDPLPRDRAGLYRVLVAGGSAAEGYFLDQGSSWPGVLQELLGQPDALSQLGARRVHVGNISRSLVPCEAIQRMFERVLPRYERLDLVLLMVGASDVVAWLEKRTPGDIEGRATPTGDVFDEHPERAYGWSAHSLALRALAARLHRRLFAPTEVRERGGARFVELRRRRREAREWIAAVPDPAPMLASFERHFRALIDAARGKGARVLVVRQPWFEKDFTAEEEAAMWNFCVGRPYVEPTTAYYTHRVVGDLLRAVDERQAAICDELGVEHLDLMPLLERSLDTYYDYLHFTPRGAREVAGHVARAILASGAAQARGTSRIDGPTPVPRHGSRSPS